MAPRTPSSTAGRPAALVRAAGLGAVAGLAGAGVMDVGERVEQALTHRPSSYVPARTLLALLGRRPGNADRPAGSNAAMHYGTGAALGALRGVWAATGVRGPRASLAHAAARLCTDQTLENATGAGAPPHTWPLREQVVDTAHKVVYALATGAVADLLVRPELESRRGTTSH